MVLKERVIQLLNLALGILTSVLLLGCTAAVNEETVLAVVDGSSVTKADLDYSLQIAHRREDLSSAGYINLKSYMDTIIDDRLIAEEARRMGMERLPEIRQAVDAYILRESVVKLYSEEIKDKISIADEEVDAYFKRDYERFTMDGVKVKSQEDAESIVARVRQGSDFNEIAEEFSGDERIVLLRKHLKERPSLEEAVIGLMPGETSDVVKDGEAFLVVRLASREKPSDEELESRRKGLASELRKQKENERSTEYLEILRKEADINIDKATLSSLDPEKVDKWMDGEKPLAEVYDSVLTLGDFAAMLRPGVPKEQILNSWIDIKLVDHEALRRDYVTNTNLGNAVRRYEDRLLRNMFIVRVIVPQIEVSEEALREYYSNNTEKYLTQERFKLQQITLKTEEEAREVRESLIGGGDFSWLAKTRSSDEVSFEGGEIGWRSISELPDAMGEAVKSLAVGDISPVIPVGGEYRIVRIQMKQDEKAQDFEKVKAAVYKDYFGAQVKELLDEYTSQLREGAAIEVYRGTLRSLEKKLNK